MNLQKGFVNNRLKMRVTLNFIFVFMRGASSWHIQRLCRVRHHVRPQFPLLHHMFRDVPNLAAVHTETTAMLSERHPPAACGSLRFHAQAEKRLHSNQLRHRPQSQPQWPTKRGRLHSTLSKVPPLPTFYVLSCARQLQKSGLPKH